MKQQTTIVILAVFTVASYWLLTNLEKELDPINEDNAVKEIAVARNVKGLYFGADNRLKYEIDSTTIHEHSNQGGTKFTHVDMRGLDEYDKTAWTGKAQTAKLSADKKVLELRGDVVLIQLPNSDNPLRAMGDHIVYYDDKKEAVSDQLIRVENNTSYQTSKQLTLDFTTKNVHFHGGVRVHHEVYTSQEQYNISKPSSPMPHYLPDTFYPPPHSID